MIIQIPHLTSIIVCAHNNAEMTHKCLTRLRMNTRAYELICVDDGSTDAHRSVAETFRLFTRNVYRIPHSGAAAARNEALKHISGVYIVFLDNDCFVPPGWLDRLEQIAMRDPKIGIVAAVPSDEDHRLLTPAGVDGLINAEEAGSACMLITRRLFEEIGYLDPVLGYAGEDTDYCFRAKLAGFRVVSAPDVRVEHLKNATRSKLSESLIEASLRHFYRKWRNHPEFAMIRECNRYV